MFCENFGDMFLPCMDSLLFSSEIHLVWLVCTSYHRNQRIGKFSGKKQDSEAESAVELASCVMEVKLLASVPLYILQKVDGVLLTIQCSNAGSLEAARGVLQQFFSKPPGPKPKVCAFSN